MLEMNPEIKKEWDKFKKFVREKHHLTQDYTPDYYSIRLWCEYQQFKKEGGK